MMKKIMTMLLCAAILPLAASAKRPVAAERWSEEKAAAWYAKQGWIVGCDYVCATAINQIEMWQAETFDPATMDREMALAEGLGFNTVRIFLSDMVYDADPDGFKKRVSQFLDICGKHGIRAIMTIWTNGGKCENPQLGKQPESVQGVHNSQWCMSPGADAVNDPAQWGRLERYVKDIIGTYKNDDRVLLWCLYNEPENIRRGVKSSLPLMRETYKWAREIDPSQPLTSPMWSAPSLARTNLAIVSYLMENSDIISFHCYSEPKIMSAFIRRLKDYNRPIVCTEYMGRPKSTFEKIMPILKENNVGAISWGLTAGKCNFHLQWSSKAGDPEPEVWFHDIYRLDGTPFSEAEVAFIRRMTGKAE